jgi:hypothetical protein
MADEAKKTTAPAPEPITTTDNETEYAEDLTVCTHERTPESHACRVARHKDTREDWTEAQRLIEEDMARRRKTVN